MALRIRSKQDLKQRRDGNNISDRAAARIESEFAELEKDDRSKAALPKRRGRGKRPASEIELLNLEACVIPPVSPADILYQAMVRRWGRFLSGGEVVWELMPFSDTDYRLDAALPRYRVAVEMDGFEFHGLHLGGFKRSRAKQLFFTRRGWLLFQVSGEQVREHLEDILDAFGEAMSYQVRQDPIHLHVYPKGWSRIIPADPTHEVSNDD